MGPAGQPALHGGTNVALSAVLEGLQRLGFRFSSADEEALLHMWRYSSYLSGIDPELLISMRDEGRIIGELIRDGEGPPDEDSRALIVALMTAAYHPMLEGAKWPAKISYAISRKLIGDPLADALGYPRDREQGLTVNVDATRADRKPPISVGKIPIRQAAGRHPRRRSRRDSLRMLHKAGVKPDVVCRAFGNGPQPHSQCGI
jgi:hypothetical protein